jgi:hypothetical protein
MKKNKIKFVKIELYLHTFFSKEKLTNMKNNVKELFITILLLLSFLPNNKLEASHVMGGDITYRIIDTSANNRRYLITLTRYRYCGGIFYGNNNLTLILPLKKKQEIGERKSSKGSGGNSFNETIQSNQSETSTSNVIVSCW